MYHVALTFALGAPTRIQFKHVYTSYDTFANEHALSLTSNQFVTKMKENIKRVDNRVNAYIKDSNENNIHDIRTAIRRLDASLDLYQRGCEIKKRFALTDQQAKDSSK